MDVKSLTSLSRAARLSRVAANEKAEDLSPALGDFDVTV
jgi:hypothetical protein